MKLKPAIFLNLLLKLASVSATVPQEPNNINEQDLQNRTIVEADVDPYPALREGEVISVHITCSKIFHRETPLASMKAISAQLPMNAENVDELSNPAHETKCYDHFIDYCDKVLTDQQFLTILNLYPEAILRLLRSDGRCLLSSHLGHITPEHIDGNLSEASFNDFYAWMNLAPEVLLRVMEREINKASENDTHGKNYELFVSAKMPRNLKIDNLGPLLDSEIWENLEHNLWLIFSHRIISSIVDEESGVEIIGHLISMFTRVGERLLRHNENLPHLVLALSIRGEGLFQLLAVGNHRKGNEDGVIEKFGSFFKVMQQLRRDDSINLVEHLGTAFQSWHSDIELGGKYVDFVRGVTQSFKVSEGISMDRSISQLQALEKYGDKLPKLLLTELVNSHISAIIPADADKYITAKLEELKERTKDLKSWDESQIAEFSEIVSVWSKERRGPSCVRALRTFFSGPSEQKTKVLTYLRDLAKNGNDHIYPAIFSLVADEDEFNLVNLEDLEAIEHRCVIMRSNPPEHQFDLAEIYHLMMENVDDLLENILSPRFHLYCEDSMFIDASAPTRQAFETFFEDLTFSYKKGSHPDLTPIMSKMIDGEVYDLFGFMYEAESLYPYAAALVKSYTMNTGVRLFHTGMWEALSEIPLEQLVMDIDDDALDAVFDNFEGLKLKEIITDLGLPLPSLDDADINDEPLDNLQKLLGHYTKAYKKEIDCLRATFNIDNDDPDSWSFVDFSDPENLKLATIEWDEDDPTYNKLIVDGANIYAIGTEGDGKHWSEEFRELRKPFDDIKSNYTNEDIKKIRTYCLKSYKTVLKTAFLEFRKLMAFMSGKLNDSTKIEYWGYVDDKSIIARAFANPKLELEKLIKAFIFKTARGAEYFDPESIEVDSLIPGHKIPISVAWNSLISSLNLDSTLVCKLKQLMSGGKGYRPKADSFAIYVKDPEDKIRQTTFGVSRTVRPIPLDPVDGESFRKALFALLEAEGEYKDEYANWELDKLIDLSFNISNPTKDKYNELMEALLVFLKAEGEFKDEYANWELDKLVNLGLEISNLAEDKGNKFKEALLTFLKAEDKYRDEYADWTLKKLVDLSLDISKPTKDKSNTFALVGPHEVKLLLTLAYDHQRDYLLQQNPDIDIPRIGKEISSFYKITEGVAGDSEKFWLLDILVYPTNIASCFTYVNTYERSSTLKFFAALLLNFNADPKAFYDGDNE